MKNKKLNLIVWATALVFTASVSAAHRAGIRRIILPERNEADTEEIPEDVSPRT